MNNKDHHQNFFIENNQDTERISISRKEALTTKMSSHKKLTRSKSVSKTFNSHIKNSQKALQTIDHSTNEKRGRSKSNQKTDTEAVNRLSNYFK